MARKARATLDSNILKITQAASGILFQSDADRDFFLKRLAQLQQKYAFKVLAFCCGESDGFQLVVDTQGANISKIMQSLTIAYAMHRKSEVKLFTQRYKSQALHSEEEVQREIRAILENPHYSGCCFKANQSVDFDWISVQPKQLYQTQTLRSPLDEEAAQVALHLWVQDHGCSLEDLLNDKVKRNQCLLEFRRQHDVSLKTLAQLFAISESSVSKILKKHELGT